jgi:hypothetical protein
VVLVQPTTENLVPVYYDREHSSSTSTARAYSSSTSTAPDPGEMATVYDLQLRRQREAAPARLPVTMSRTTYFEITDSAGLIEIDLEPLTEPDEW